MWINSKIYHEKPSCEPKGGETVFIGDDHRKIGTELFWLIAKIIQLITGQDKEVHTVRLKIQHGTVLHPVPGIFPLEIEANESCITHERTGKEESNSETGSDIKTDPDEKIYFFW